MIIQETVKFHKIWNCVHLIPSKNDQLFIANFFSESYKYIIFFFKKADHHSVFILHFDISSKNLPTEIKKIYAAKEF